MTRAKMKAMQSVRAGATFAPIPPATGGSANGGKNRDLMVERAKKALVAVGDPDAWHKYLAPLSLEEKRAARVQAAVILRKEVKS